MEYYLEFEKHKKMSLAEFAVVLRLCPKKSAGTVQLAELCYMAGYPNGLYLFFDNEEELWYIGKATSRSFIERVPSHFDQRHDAWFNTLPRKIMSACQIRSTQMLTP
jgi:hypothetical protein